MSIEPERQRDLVTLRARIDALRLTDFELWVAYIRCGGHSDLLACTAYLYGALDMPDVDWEGLQHSVWEAETF